jgi:hypothetical protein
MKSNYNNFTKTQYSDGAYPGNQFQASAPYGSFNQTTRQGNSPQYHPDGPTGFPGSMHLAGKNQHIYNFLKTAFQNADSTSGKTMTRFGNELYEDSIADDLSSQVSSFAGNGGYGFNHMDSRAMTIASAFGIDPLGALDNKRMVTCGAEQAPWVASTTRHSIAPMAKSKGGMGQSTSGPQSPALNRVDSYYGNYEAPPNLQNQMLQGSKIPVPSDYRSVPDGML